MNRTLKPLLLMLLGCVLAAGSLRASDDPYAAQREAMVAEIEEDVRRTSERIGQTALDPRVMESMQRTPRHEFVPDDLKRFAYENRPLPIGYGQTISQPYIVALMTALLKAGKDSVVLEIGTGSGCQAAILAALVTWKPMPSQTA